MLPPPHRRHNSFLVPPHVSLTATIPGRCSRSSGNTFLVTEKEYDNFILEMDIRADDTSSNSGVQTRSHYNPAAQNAFKPGQYNHIRIECIGNSMKTWLNGTAIASLVDTIDAKGFIGLQVHAIRKDGQAGAKVYFKNIRIRTTGLHSTPFPKGTYVVNNVTNTLTLEEKNSGWQLLFDGKSSQGWVGAYKKAFPERGWEIKNGMISVLAAQGKEAGNGGAIVTTKEYKAFDLSFEFFLTPGANNGVKYFVTLTENNKGSAIGPEYQVLDDTLHPDAKLGRNGDRTMSSLYNLIRANKQKRFIHPMGQWNTGRIVVYPNNHVEHFLNGVEVLE